MGNTQHEVITSELLNKKTKAELHQILDKRGIPYKSKDTNSILIKAIEQSQKPQKQQTERQFFGEY